MSQKITEDQLRRIIKEELGTLDEASPWFNMMAAAAAGGRASEERARAAAAKKRAAADKPKPTGPRKSSREWAAEEQERIAAYKAEEERAAKRALDRVRGFDPDKASEVESAKRTADPDTLEALAAELGKASAADDVKRELEKWASTHLASDDLSKIQKALTMVPKKIKPIVSKVVTPDSLKSLYDAGNARAEAWKARADAAKAAKAAPPPPKKPDSFFGKIKGALGFGPKTEALLRQAVREALVAESSGWEDQFRPGGEVARGREAFADALARALKGMKLPHPVVATDLTPRGDVRVWLDTPGGLMKAVLTVDYDTPPEGERVPR